jgi:PTS system cellobiose-specific IIA component
MALRAAKKGNFEEATKYIEEANKEMLKAHEIQTNLIVKEAGGEKIEVGLIMVHSQDHLMNAILFKDLAQEFIDLYKKIEENK